MYMSKTQNQNSTVVQNLDSTLKDAAEGYGDLVAISVVHKVSMRALRSRLKELQIERVRKQV
jgi:polysaccharide deacetylase 2 family uncharacterized protein YibQ